ncbi:Tim44/TimA family putative adaptor protein [Kiloniella laminariae]|uniref:Tim44/TimA family putative adaptor protein n=1 Tax=Kiloniella laminariae TaxID=454162 RepID=A0ABT4LJB1_9PROT|nr:Tim44/TimA family putative adaptor protein [Kiloniella laminariae]MCZ4281197.1 Tim44/TimA family putative adaptor protein [Kiloniella laminariae]
MGNGFPVLEIILLAAVAVFLALRLRSTLGKRTGFEKRPGQDSFVDDKSSKDNVVNLPPRDRHQGKDSPFADDSRAEPVKEVHASSLHAGKMADDILPADSALAAGLSEIEKQDRDFDSKEFVQGAGIAFEMIVAAYASGDKNTLRDLLADEVYRDFQTAIDDREAANQTHETVLVGVSDVDIVDAEMRGRYAVVTVKFVSQQVNVTRDAEGQVVDGDSNHTAKVTDIWSFARDTRSKNPNWLLVETRSPN